jgi:GT2 family glycosyltransferase
LVYNNYNQINILPQNNYHAINASENNFLSGAYNYALKQAIETQKKWLLLLDQDTELTNDYFEELIKIFDMDTPENLGAIIPQVKSEKIFISPKKYFPLIGPYIFRNSIKKNGVYINCISAINSGTVLDVKAISKIGGFSLTYPLDVLDTWYFFRLYKEKKCFYVMDAVLEQDLSVLDYSKMTIHRYQSILNAELQFSKELRYVAVFLWKLKIPLRTIKKLLYRQERKYALLTLSYLFK